MLDTANSTAIEGSVVIVKFYANPASSNAIVTRTLKKIGVIDRAFQGTMPQDGEMWKVKIVREICSGQCKGCFVLTPLELVDPGTIVKIVPGMYDELIKNKILFIFPKSPTYNCILPLELKKKLNSYRAVLVKLKEGTVGASS